MSVHTGLRIRNLSDAQATPGNAELLSLRPARKPPDNHDRINLQQRQPGLKLDVRVLFLHRPVSVHPHSELRYEISAAVFGVLRHYEFQIV